MSKQCFSCAKKPKAGNNVSHSNKKTKRVWNPNLQKVNIVIADKNTGKPKKVKKYVCTKCLKAGKVVKAV